MPEEPLFNESAEERVLFTFQHGLQVAREQMHIWVTALLFGLLCGFAIYLVTPRTYEAKGTFLVDQLPFQTASENATDPDTIHEMVQSLILSIPGRDLKRAVAKGVGVKDSALSFVDKEPPIWLTGFDVKRGNIRVTATRNSRLGVITVQSRDPEFAVRVVNAVLEELMQMNKLAGRLGEVQSRLVVANGTSHQLVQELVTAIGQRIKLEKQVQELREYTKHGFPLSDFEAFNTDPTLNNLKTQLILVESEYKSLAATSTRGAKLEGKRAEVEGLKMLLHGHAQKLAEAMNSSYEISKTQESAVRHDIAESEKGVNLLQAQRGDFTRAFSDFGLRKRLLADTGSDLSGEASVIAVVERGSSERRPVRPSFFLDLFLGALLGLSGGGVLAFLFHVLDSRLRTPFQIERATGYPCIAVMPVEKERPTVFSDAPSPLNFLRGQILRAAFTGEGSKVFAFTAVGEKADSLEVVAQLAILLAKSEKRTLVIDVDVARHGLAKRLGIAAKSGLADWLFADDELERHISYSAIQELAIIDSGKLSGDVDSLFSRRPVAPEISRLASKWDFILIHGPALLAHWHLFMAVPEQAQLVAVAAYQAATTKDIVEVADRAASAKLSFYGIVLDHVPEETGPLPFGKKGFLSPLAKTQA
ncbi:MAG: hypothetical protein PW734_08450 [Verrucomicrobium sp.]|nr:hypothetical protein [Verrucomicrobium sp.]